MENGAGTYSSPASASILVTPLTTATPSGGVYDSSQNVTLSTNVPATIHYTTNGTTPTTSSPVYSSPLPISADTTLSFFSVDSVGNVESPIKQQTYYILSGGGSIAALKSFSNNQSVRLGDKALYLEENGFGYIEEPDRSSGIRVEGNISSNAGDQVCLVGYMVVSAGAESYIEVLAMSTDGQLALRPLGANNKWLSCSLLNGIYVKAWGVVQPGTIKANSYVISDGWSGSGITVITPGTPTVTEGSLVNVKGAAGLSSSQRVIYSQ